MNIYHKEELLPTVVNPKIIFRSFLQQDGAKSYLHEDDALIKAKVT
jgi:hypothetical protein